MLYLLGSGSDVTLSKCIILPKTQIYPQALNVSQSQPIAATQKFPIRFSGSRVTPSKVSPDIFPNRTPTMRFFNSQSGQKILRKTKRIWSFRSDTCIKFYLIRFLWRRNAEKRNHKRASERARCRSCLKFSRRTLWTKREININSR